MPRWSIAMAFGAFVAPAHPGADPAAPDRQVAIAAVALRLRGASRLAARSTVVLMLSRRSRARGHWTEHPELQNPLGIGRWIVVWSARALVGDLDRASSSAARRAGRRSSCASVGLDGVERQQLKWIAAAVAVTVVLVAELMSPDLARRSDAMWSIVFFSIVCAVPVGDRHRDADATGCTTSTA